MARYLFSSHDGYGLGHARRNTLIAQALLRHDPLAEIVVVSGISPKRWVFSVPRIQVVHVPPLVKDADGSYATSRTTFEGAVAERQRIFRREVESFRPDVVIVDRHPFGIADELRDGLVTAKESGASLILGLRDVLDEPSIVQGELEGRGWRGATDLYDRFLVYGSRNLCDHEEEYGLPVTPSYCGFVTEVAPAASSTRDLLVVAAGGGGDGERVFELGASILAANRLWRGLLAVGPYANERAVESLGIHEPDRIEVRRNVQGYTSILTRAWGTIQMAGYNSTFEALGAGLRPILVPRRSPRREQAIRATRLAALGLADVVDSGASYSEVMWFLGRDRLLDSGSLSSAGISLDGAERAAELVSSMVARPAST